MDSRVSSFDTARSVLVVEEASRGARREVRLAGFNREAQRELAESVRMRKKEWASLGNGFEAWRWVDVEEEGGGTEVSFDV